jgi:amino acid adenylation domain-containing protein
LPPGRTICTRRLCIPQLVSQIAASDPEKVALYSGAARLSYGELEGRSNRLASHLRQLGVQPEVVVAICLERSFDFVIAALAVWKAGGAYLPLDSTWPVARRDAIVENAAARVLISRPELGGKAEILVDLDRDSLAIAMAQTPVHSGTRRELLAYVSYTSGTTGAPKGVEITHGNLLNLVFWHRRAFGITPTDRCSHLASLAFDAAVWELWPHLSAGATVVLVDENVRTSPELLQDWLVRERIHVAFVPTTLAEPLIASAWPADTALRYLLTGSDVLHRYPATGLPFKLVNNYGPTECTVVATSGVVSAAGHSSVLPNIGAGIANTPIYLLNEDLEQVKPGEIGEIFIGGANVGRGYRNQPDLTEQRFLPDPFAGVMGARMYRSGDLGSLLPSGEIQFHGRIDNQQKIRGHRVEPDEVASVLSRHPQVKSCAVTGYDDISDRKLAAYFVPRQSTPPEPRELREFLRERLPEYMIPSAFIRIDALPLNSRGKLDRDALPAPTSQPAYEEAEFRAPESPFERQVAATIARLMNLPRVGLDDNFFLLGGHSLVGTQLVLRIRERFGIDLSLRHLFETQTVGNLAAKVENLLLAKLESMDEEEAGRMLAALEAEQR